MRSEPTMPITPRLPQADAHSAHSNPTARTDRPRAWQLLFGAAAGVLLAGCVTVRDGATPPPPPPPPQATPAEAGRDLVTESDETETAKRARLRLELAAAYFADGKTATALDEVKQSLAINPRQSAAYNLRGLIYASINELTLAEDSYREALKLKPNDADTLHNYGFFLCQQRRFDEANQRFEAALAVPQYRDKPKTYLAQGVCRARAGDLAGAEAQLKRGFELDPSNPAISMNLADVLYLRGDYDRARFYVRRVNNVRELSNSESLWLAARIEHKLGNKAAANDFGNQLRDRFPNSREASRFDKGQWDE